MTREEFLIKMKEKCEEYHSKGSPVFGLDSRNKIIDKIKDGEVEIQEQKDIKNTVKKLQEEQVNQEIRKLQNSISMSLY